VYQGSVGPETTQSIGLRRDKQGLRKLVFHDAGVNFTDTLTRGRGYAKPQRVEERNIFLVLTFPPLLTVVGPPSRHTN